MPIKSTAYLLLQTVLCAAFLRRTSGWLVHFYSLKRCLTLLEFIVQSNEVTKINKVMKIRTHMAYLCPVMEQKW